VVSVGTVRGRPHPRRYSPGDPQSHRLGLRTPQIRVPPDYVLEEPSIENQDLVLLGAKRVWFWCMQRLGLSCGVFG